MNSADYIRLLYQKNEHVIDVAARNYPQLKSKLPEIDISTVKKGGHFEVDVKKTEKDLGIKVASFETAMKDTIGKLLELEKEVGV